MEQVGKRIAAGAAWMTLFRVVDRGLGVVSVVVLARLLVPDDFGLVAMAMVIVAMVELFGAFGFDAAIIQKQHAARAHLDTAWTLSAAIGLFNSLVVCLLAYPAAVFYGEARLAAIMFGAAAAVALGGLTNVGVVIFRRDMQFRQEFSYLLGRRLAGFLAGILLAYFLRNYWALVIGSILSAGLGVVLSFAMHPYRPRLSVAAFREIFGFSKWLFLNNLLLFASNRSSDFIIGKLAGPSVLGTYNLALEISTLPTVNLVATLNRVTLAGYARVASNPEALRAEYSRVLAFVALLVVPAGVGIAATASPLVMALLGAKWLAAIPLVKVLGVYGLVAGLSGNNGMVYLSMGRSSLVALVQAGHVMVLIPALVFATTTLGALGAAWTLLACAFLYAVLDYVVVMRILEIRFLTIARVLWRPLLASAAMWGIVRAIDGGAGAIATTLEALARLMLLVGAGAASYCVLITLLWVAAGRPEGAEKVLQRTLWARLARTP